MPASMMSAPTGSMPKVIGNSMVMVAIGPTPGRTPINVPIKQPRKQSQRFFKVSATARPSARLDIRSNVTSGPSTREGALQRRKKIREPFLAAGVGVRQEIGNEAKGIKRNGQVEELFEQQARKQGQRHGKNGNLRGLRFVGAQGGHDHGQRARNEETAPADGQGEQDHGTEHEKRATNGPALESRTRTKQALHDEYNAKGRDQDR